MLFPQALSNSGLSYWLPVFIFSKAQSGPKQQTLYGCTHPKTLLEGPSLGPSSVAWLNTHLPKASSLHTLQYFMGFPFSVTYFKSYISSHTCIHAMCHEPLHDVLAYQVIDF